MCLKRTEAMVTESEIEKNPFTDNITLLAEKLKQISLDCPGQFNIHSLKISSQFGCLRQHSLTNSHQVIHIQSLNYAPERSEKTMIKIQMPGIQMPIGDPLPIPIPKLSIGPLSDISREKCKQSAIRSKGATIESEKKEAVLSVVMLPLTGSEGRKILERNTDLGRNWTSQSSCLPIIPLYVQKHC
ncbi:uncharacterized protein LOC120310111 isoform X5 [Crotalus tigris]|uniref:uncharacterized protein LOC120297652 isoform X5 n=1 Tax=Crotalus tigris TaxID=88082 RepID=UPI00192F77E4|nr:uncharacterized protein LOC120297652 isoform X5 [Crotalus tigris]XP_039204092.1 uncharacterized protein LOC120310111 isoform X5 [Crotalus tigris]